MGQVNKNLVSHSDHNFALFRFNDQGQICLDDYVIPWVTHFEMQNFAKGTAQLNLEIIVRLDKEMTFHEAENQSNDFTDDGISPALKAKLPNLLLELLRRKSWAFDDKIKIVQRPSKSEKPSSKYPAIFR